MSQKKITPAGKAGRTKPQGRVQNQAKGKAKKQSEAMEPRVVSKRDAVQPRQKGHEASTQDKKKNQSGLAQNVNKDNKEQSPQQKDDVLNTLHDWNELGKNMFQAGLQGMHIYQTWLQSMASEEKSQLPLSATLDPLNMMHSWQELWSRAASQPEKWIAFQQDYNQRLLKLWQASLEKNGDSLESHPNKESVWAYNLIIDFIRRSHVLATDSFVNYVDHLGGDDEKKRARLKFLTKRAMDAVSPNNFIVTNPELLKATMEEKGANLVRGFENMLEDLYRGGGQHIKISRSEEAFVLGENIASTPGKVIFRNHVMELIQYEALTEEVHETPLLIVPPWINKYYILDLTEEKSFIRWCVTQGYTVFCISWVNPDESLRNEGIETYSNQGVVKAVEVVRDICSVDQVHSLGYCMGGTLLSITAAWMSQEESYRKAFASMTLLTSMLDFEESGEIGVYLDDAAIVVLDRLVETQGYLDSTMMETAFSNLRAQDLIWDFVVNNYLFGKSPRPFDLLYWNGDGTRNTVAMYYFLIHSLYRENRLNQPGAIQFLGHGIDLGQINVPAYALATKTDHIAPWKSCYRSIKGWRAPVRFVLAVSGHIAGVINAPSRKKYGWFHHPELIEDPEAWLAGAKHTKGSWWEDWMEWLSEQKQEPKVAARTFENSRYPPILPAPGDYVRVKSVKDLREKVFERQQQEEV